MKKKFFLLTTVSMSLDFFREQIGALNQIYDVTVISSPSNQLKDIADRERVKYRGIEIKRDISITNDIISFIKLLFLLLAQKPYIIHCNTPKASLLGLLAGKMTGVPKRIYYIHGLRYEGTFGKKRTILKFLEKVSCLCATNIIAVGHGVKKIVENELTDKKVDIIHNGSANGMFIHEFTSAKYDVQKIRKELEIDDEDFVFGFVGRIVRDKGINELVHAFNNMQNNKAKLLLVGFYENDLDPIAENTKRIIEDNNNIISLGYQQDVKKYLSITDLFVSPSYREGFGLSLMEANLMGVPTIATKITGYSEIVEEGINGFFIPVKDVEALQKKMTWVFENRLILENMKETCRNVVIEKYNHFDVLEAAIDYYKKL